MPDNFEYAVEFRHPSWLKKDTWSMLTRHDIAYAISDSSIRALGKVVITSYTHAFIRWHGRGKKSWYDYNYSKRQLQSWAKKFEEIQDRVSTVYGYFNNDVNAYAPFNAFDLIRFADNNERYRRLEAIQKDFAFDA